MFQTLHLISPLLRGLSSLPGVPVDGSSGSSSSSRSQVMDDPHVRLPCLTENFGPSRPMWELRTDLLKGPSRASGVMEETPSYPKGKILPGALGSTGEYL